MLDKGYKQGFEQGFADARSHKPRKPKPAFLKSLLSNTYMEQYSRGYKDGHFAGIREVRKQEVLRVQSAERERTSQERGR